MFKSNRIVTKSKIDTLVLEKRVQLEAEITDARSEAIHFAEFQQIETDFTQYVAGAPWRQYLFGFLGPVQGKTVLDIACGYSMTPVILALAGATVYAVDVAPKTIATVQRYAEYKGVADRLHVHVGPAERLPFADEKFDLLFGGAALHHLQLNVAGPELARVLKQGGRGAFQDPLGHNLLLEFARDRLPYKHKHPVKGTDRPLALADVKTFGRYFTTCTYRGFDLASMAAKVLRLRAQSPWRKALQQTDSFLFDHVPYLQRYARFIVTCVTR
ncbi:MAG: class I SAM-dependent methyltransferase [Caldilineaceae bacterium]|nr:class I SAM-dependent methyltransferase [Caldilineaceae bacterium]